MFRRLSERTEVPVHLIRLGSFLVATIVFTAILAIASYGSFDDASSDAARIASEFYSNVKAKLTGSSSTAAGSSSSSSSFPPSYFTSSETSTLSPLSGASSQQAVLDIKGGCSNVESYTYGRWVRRLPGIVSPLTIGITQEKQGHCFPLNGPAAGTPGYKEREDARLVEVANWEWSPDYCPMRARSTIDWLTQLLRMPRGIIYVGDSLAGQQMTSLQVMLGGAGETEDYLLLNANTPTSIAPERESFVQGGSTWLNPSHPFTRSLQKMYKSIGQETWFKDRIRHPVLTQLFTTHLVPNQVLGPLVKANGGTSDAGRSKARYPTWHDAHWMEKIYNISRLYDEPLPEGAPTYIRTPVIVNSGPHWTPLHIVGLDEKDPFGNALKAYKGMVRVNTILFQVYAKPCGGSLQVKNVTAAFDAIPDRANRIRPIYRSHTSVPLPCSSFKSPVESLSKVKPAKQYNYAIMPAMDQAWKETGIEVLNITYIAGLRPEARRDPGKGDCLHVCLPIAQTYNDVLFSTIF